MIEALAGLVAGVVLAFVALRRTATPSSDLTLLPAVRDIQSRLDALGRRVMVGFRKVLF